MIAIDVTVSKVRLPLPCVTNSGGGPHLHFDGRLRLKKFLGNSLCVHLSISCACTRVSQGQWVELACSKSGSRVLDTLWGVATLKQKQSVAQELVKHEHRLRGDHFGRCVCGGGGGGH